MVSRRAEGDCAKRLDKCQCMTGLSKVRTKNLKRPDLTYAPISTRKHTVFP